MYDFEEFLIKTRSSNNDVRPWKKLKTLRLYSVSLGTLDVTLLQLMGISTKFVVTVLDLLSPVDLIPERNQV